MTRRFITASDIEDVPDDGLLVVPAEAIVTDRAREMASARGVQIRVEDGSRQPDNPGSQPKAKRKAGQGRVAMGADHAGFELKEYLKLFLIDSRYEVNDLGTNSTDPVDYPDIAKAVAEAVASSNAWRGIVVDGAGIGSAIAANKIRGVRAALCYDRATARNSRQHNDANVLILGARLLPPEEAREIVAVWLETAFAGGRHQGRVDKIKALESATDASTKPASGPASSQSGENLVEAVTREVLCRLGDKEACKLIGLEIDDVVCPGCDARCVENCPDKARRVVAAGADRLVAGQGISRVPADIAALIDHTLLRPEASLADIKKLCEEARQFGFATVCVNPGWVGVAAAALRGSNVKVCTVAGFPLGATLSSVKRHEAEEAVKMGAQEVDIVINVGALKSAQYERVEQDIRGVVEASHRGGALCKVILECVLLTDQEKVIACRLAQTAGADFVKTSTGFASGGATAHDVELMRLVVGPGMGVKAAGGIRTYEDLQKMLSAGATRIGASASVKILKEAAGATPKAEAATLSRSSASY